MSSSNTELVNNLAAIFCNMLGANQNEINMNDVKKIVTNNLSKSNLANDSESEDEYIPFKVKPSATCTASCMDNCRPQPTGFGARPQAQPQTSGGFGARPQAQPQPSGGFGARPQAQPQPSGGFGARPQAQPTGFGARPQAQPTGFGARPQPTGFGTQPTSGFGARPQQHQSQPFGGLGAQPQSQPSAGFGARPQPQQAGLWGQPQSQPSAGFGARLQPQPSAGFGSQPQHTSNPNVVGQKAPSDNMHRMTLADYINMMSANRNTQKMDTPSTGNQKQQQNPIITNTQTMQQPQQSHPSAATLPPYSPPAYQADRQQVPVDSKPTVNSLITKIVTNNPKLKDAGAMFEKAITSCDTNAIEKILKDLAMHSKRSEMPACPALRTLDGGNIKYLDVEDVLQLLVPGARLCASDIEQLNEELHEILDPERSNDYTRLNVKRNGVFTTIYGFTKADFPSIYEFLEMWIVDYRDSIVVV